LPSLSFPVFYEECLIQQVVIYYKGKNRDNSIPIDDFCNILPDEFENAGMMSLAIPIKSGLN